MEWPGELEGAPQAAINAFMAIYKTAIAVGQDAKQARQDAMTAVAGRWLKNTDGVWVETQTPSAENTVQFRASMAPGPGLMWEAVLIAPGISQSSPPFYWPENVLEAAVDLFTGVDINAYELRADFFSHLPISDVSALEDIKRYLVAKKVGAVSRAWWQPGDGIRGEIAFYPGQQWLPDMLRQDPAALGLSIDARVHGYEVSVGGMTIFWVTRIVFCSSVDVVTYPAAGGKFIRAIQGLLTKGNIIMTKEQLLALIAKTRPDLLNGRDQAMLTDDEVSAMAQMAMTPLVSKLEMAAVQGLSADQVAEIVTAKTQEIEKRAACARALDQGLANSHLPQPAIDRIRAKYDGQIFNLPEIGAEIKAEREYIALMSSPSGLDIPDQTRMQVGTGPVDKAQMAVDRMFGLTKTDMQSMARMSRLDNKPFFENMRAAQAYDGFEDIPAFGSLREMYAFLTGDPEVTGRFNRQSLPADLRAAQDITSATFAYVLGNTLSRRLIKDYNAMDYQENLLISIRKPVRDFRQQEAVMVGYFPDLSTLDPETNDYTEISGVTDEESTYTIGQKGNLLTITRKTIINDDLSLIQRLVGRVGRAARRTHAKYVWSKYTANANCSDGTAWFTGGHGNLTASALGFATALAGYQALAKMTEKDSGERIGLLDDPSVKPVLIYPVDLMATGDQIVNDDYYFSANDLTTKVRNSLKGKITGAMVSLLTDTNNWGLLLPPSVADMVEMGYLNGRQEPEMFVADTPQSEQVFVADKIRHKIRHEYAGAVIDFRTGYAGIVG